MFHPSPIIEIRTQGASNDDSAEEFMLLHDNGGSTVVTRVDGTVLCAAMRAHARQMEAAIRVRVKVRVRV